MAMFPHERSLVKKLSSKPFALLGVNTDTDRNQVKAANKKQQITWRSWFDGQGGPICSQYQVQGFPTLMVIDAKGVIRHKFVGSPGEKKLDDAIDTLLKDAQKKSTSSLGLPSDHAIADASDVDSSVETALLRKEDE